MCLVGFYLSQTCQLDQDNPLQLLLMLGILSASFGLLVTQAAARSHRFHRRFLNQAVTSTHIV